MTRTMDTPTVGVLDALTRRTLMDVLSRIPERLEDLDVTITRTDAMAPEALGSSGHKNRVVPFNQRASDARVELQTAVRIFAFRVHAAVSPGPVVLTGPVNQVRFLQDALPAVPNDAPCITGIYERIVGAYDRSTRAVDRPVARVYVGRCDGDCNGSPLYAAKDRSPEVRCRVCSKRHDVQAHREAMIKQARDMIAAPAELARVLPWFVGSAVQAATIRKWAERGKLTPVEVDGWTMYRIGEVLDLHAESVARSAAPV
ncbi:hypothetical protein ACWEQ4_01155 [Rhodococcus sp. NPDC003994]